jgi:hypothetical protein
MAQRRRRAGTLLEAGIFARMPSPGPSSLQTRPRPPPALQKPSPLAAILVPSPLLRDLRLRRALVPPPHLPSLRPRAEVPIPFCPAHGSQNFVNY